MSGEREEVILTVPAELTKTCQGVALDMGGTMMKFVYRTKEDVDRATSEGSKYGRLRLVAFTRNEMREGLDYIKKRAFIRPSDSSEPPVVSMTGVGCTQFSKRICETLGIRLENLTEFDCFAKSFVYFAHRLPRQYFLEPFDTDALNEPIEFTKSQMMAMTMAQSKGLTQSYSLPESIEQQIMSTTGRHPADGVSPPVDTPLSEAEPEMFPCMLAMIGSGVGLMKVERDGTFKVIDGSNRGGRSFFGIGTLLTGCKTFDELVQLASLGDHHNVDQFSNDLTDSADIEETEDSLYKMMQIVKPSLVYSFGKAAIGSDVKFSREDLARAWLNYIALDLTQCIYTVCQLHGIKRLFFCGGFCDNPFVRHVLTSEMTRRNTFWSLLAQSASTVVFDFIKPGKYLGSLGCMVSGLDSIVKPTE